MAGEDVEFRRQDYGLIREEVRRRLGGNASSRQILAADAAVANDAAAGDCGRETAWNGLGLE